MGYQFVPTVGPASMAFFGYGVVCALTVILTVPFQPRRARAAFVLIGLGIIAMVAGDGVWSFYEVFRGQPAPFPSAADVLYLSGYPLQLVGLSILLRRGSPSRDGAALIDASIIACGAASLGWTFIIRSSALDDGLTFLERAVSISYPIADVLLLAVVSRMLLSAGRRGAEAWFAAALLATLAADVIYSVQTVGSTYSSGSWVDSIWLVGYACWAIAALHPASVHPAEQREASGPVTFGPLRVALLASAALLAPACMLFWFDERSAPDLLIIAATSAVAFGLVMVRLVLALRALQAAHATIKIAQHDRQRLLSQIVEAAEYERIRVATELHDGPVQALSALGFDLQLGLLSLHDGDNADVDAIIRRTAATIAHEVADIRQLMSGLRPPILDEGGVVVAIEEHLRTVAQRSGVDINFVSDVREEVPSAIETTLYRVTQEAMSNVVRHAGAAHARVELRISNGWAKLIVADDGRGFSPRSTGELLRSGHYGLAGVSERAAIAGGSLQVQTAPNRGTTLVVALPNTGPARLLEVAGMNRGLLKPFELRGPEPDPADHDAFIPR